MNQVSKTRIERISLLKSLKKKDAELILSIQHKVYQSEAKIYNDYDIPPLTQTIHEITKDFDKFSFLKLSVDGEIVGSIKGYVEDRTCHIGRVIVDEAYQNKGYGTMLMKAMENHFSYVTRYELFTGNQSVKNIHLYEKLGYIIFKEKQLTTKTNLIYMEKVVSVS